MTTLYEPTHLKRWTMPDSYFGAEWPEYYGSGFGQHRDSDCLTRANFDAALKAIQAATTLPEDAENDEGESIHPQVVSASHWAVGWVEWIAIHETDEGALKCADELQEGMDGYPVVDDELFSQYESDEADESWKNYGRKDFVDQVAKDYELSDLAKDALGEIDSDILRSFFEDNSNCPYEFDSGGCNFRPESLNATREVLAAFLRANRPRR